MKYGKGPGRRGTRRVPEYGCLVVFAAFVLAAAGFLVTACSGNPPPYDPVDVARAICYAQGGSWTEPAGPCVYPPPPPPPPPDPCAVCTPEQTCVDGVCIDPPPPPPPPPPTGCTLGTLKASETPRAKITPQKISRMIVGAGPTGCFGKAYYASAEMDWPEAAAEGRECGPIAREGHPQRMACEAVFMGQPCPTFSAVNQTGHISFDPWFVIGGVNQNHPANVKAGCGTQFVDHESWVKEDYGGHLYIQSGMWNAATAHDGKNKPGKPKQRFRIKTCIAGGTICGVSTFWIDNY